MTQYNLAGDPLNKIEKFLDAIVIIKPALSTNVIFELMVIIKYFIRKVIIFTDRDLKRQTKSTGNN